MVDLQRGLDDEFDFGDIGGGGGEEYEQEEEEEEEEGEERISWAAKGKYPAEIEKDTVIPGYEKEEEGEDESMEDEDEGYESQEVLPYVQFPPPFSILTDAHRLTDEGKISSCPKPRV